MQLSRRSLLLGAGAAILYEPHLTGLRASQSSERITLRASVTVVEDHRTLQGLEHFTSVLKRSDVPKKTVDIFVNAFDPMAKRIAQMQNRAMTGD
jgi:hypothetical protein